MTENKDKPPKPLTALLDVLSANPHIFLSFAALGMVRRLFKDQDSYDKAYYKYLKKHTRRQGKQKGSNDGIRVLKCCPLCGSLLYGSDCFTCLIVFERIL